MLFRSYVAYCGAGQHFRRGGAHSPATHHGNRRGAQPAQAFRPQQQFCTFRPGHRSDAEIVVMRAEALECLPIQHLPVVRVCYAYEEFCTLLQGPAVEVHGAILGDDPMRV